MKGIILAGGTGTRLFPMTKACCKQLLPIYDKPMIYYPLSVLMLADISEILIISTPRDLPLIQSLLGDGSQLGMSFEYCIQDEPKGIGQAFLLGEAFIGNDNVCLILGDNIFYGQIFCSLIQKAAARTQGATVFAYYVSDPSAYGVIDFDANGKAVSLEEKPKNPKSNYAIPGLYFFDNKVVHYAKQMKPSARGELEILDIVRAYLERGALNVELLGRGMAWLDTGTPTDLLKAAMFVETIQNRTGLYVACLEEIAYKMGYISRDQLILTSKGIKNTEYRQYLEHLLDDDRAYIQLTS